MPPTWHDMRTFFSVQRAVRYAQLRSDMGSGLESLMPPRDTPTYGTSLHYAAGKGEEYFRYQDLIGSTGGVLEAAKFAPYIPLAADVLDFGCGAGHLLAELKCAGKVGVEINPVARSEVSKKGLTCYADLSEVPHSSVDVAISNHALEHVPYPIAALREIRRSLRPGGKLILCVPIDDWRASKAYVASDINHHLNTWTPQLLGNTLVEAGYEVRTSSIRILTHAWPPRAAALYRVSPTLYRLTGFLWSVLTRRRQLLAVVDAP